MKHESALAVESLTKIYGAGCPFCTICSPMDVDRNRCPVCGTVVACMDVSLDLMPGEILGIVGESGSGKTTLVRCLHFDVPASSGRMYMKAIDEGQSDLLELSPQRRRHIRNHMMGIVYQNPLMGIKADLTAGGNIAEKLLEAGIMHFGIIRGRAGELLQRTEVPLERMDDYPSSFSGGMQQRVQISKALANNPQVLLLDEVTTGLDLSVQARVLDLIKEIQHELGISMIVVSHDLGVIRLLADRTMVMKNGRVVESGLTDQVLEDPQHHYTQILVNSML